MTLRAVSAKSSWLTPLAVLAPILAIIVASVWALTVFPPLVLVMIAAGLAVTAVAGQRTYGARLALAVAGLTLVAGVVALFVSFWAFVVGPVCGKDMVDAWRWVPFAAGALVYFALGSYGFRTERAHSIVPLALVAGLIVMLVLVALVPGTQGFCD